MLLIPFLSQPLDSTYCGATCLKMLLDSVGHEYDLDDIFEKASKTDIFGERFCRNSLMIKYVKNLGFQATIVLVKKLKKILKSCTKNNINVILHIRSAVDSPLGHYVVFLKYKNGKVYVNDPAKTHGGTVIKFKTLKN